MRLQTFSFTHPGCPFLQKTQSSIALMYLEPHKGHVITSCCQEYSAFFCQHSFRMCRLNCWFFCWPLTAHESLHHVLLPATCSSPLPVPPCWCGSIWCRVCLQVPGTRPYIGLCLHSQQSNIHPPTSQNHLKMDAEHPKTDTSCSIHTACPAAAQEKLTALQTTSTGA